MSVLIGLGDGTFQSKTNYSVGDRPVTVASRDLNDDSELDLVTANAGSDSISVLLGNGDGTFQAQQTFPAGNGLVSASLAHLNKDNALDVIALNNANNTPEICTLFGSGTGMFDMPECFAIPADPNVFTNSPHVAATVMAHFRLSNNLTSANKGINYSL